MLPTCHANSSTFAETFKPKLKKHCLRIEGSPCTRHSQLRWLLDHVPAVSSCANLKFGTVDSWLIYNLTGGAAAAAHVTDVTNASRTMLMNLRTLDWDDALLDFFGVPRKVLPEIKSSAEVYGHLGYPGCEWGGVPIAGVLGDQQAALVGQVARYCSMCYVAYFRD